MEGWVEGQNLKELIGVIGAIIVGISAVIQISPIRINPWSWVAKKIGRAINSELFTEMNEFKSDISGIKDDIAEVKKDADERNAKADRTKILRFGDELLHDVEHSKEHFDEILMCITEYTEYCNKHREFKNNITEETTKHIIRAYKRCMEEKTFL